jgi:hypothetical protein
MITIKRQKLNNGLPVFYIRNPGLIGVNLSLFIKVGSSAGQKVYTPAQEAELISDIEFREIKQMQNEILNKDNCFMFRMSPAS